MIVGSWDEIKKLTKKNLLSLVQTYSDYVMEFSEEHREDGCYPVCLPEFYDNEWQIMGEGD